MAIQTICTDTRAHIDFLIDEVIKNREVVIIKRRGSEDVAVITIDKLPGIRETAYLLCSPINLNRLLTALDRVRKGTRYTINNR